MQFLLDPFGSAIFNLELWSFWTRLVVRSFERSFWTSLVQSLSLNFIWSFWTFVMRSLSLNFSPFGGAIFIFEFYLVLLNPFVMQSLSLNFVIWWCDLYL